MHARMHAHTPSRTLTIFAHSTGNEGMQNVYSENIRAGSNKTHDILLW